MAIAGTVWRYAYRSADIPCATISAIGARPSSSAFARDVTTTAAAPSEICEALPAVIVPSFLNAGLSAASASAVVPGRIPSSRATTTGSPLRCGISTGTTSSARRPSLQAASAR